MPIIIHVMIPGIAPSIKESIMWLLMLDDIIVLCDWLVRCSCSLFGGVGANLAASAFGG